MGLHYKFYANPLLCHLLILCTCNPHQQCSLIRCCVIYLCIFYKTYSWGFIEHLGMLTRLYLASFLHCTYINFFFWFYVSRWQTELVIPCALCARHICSSFFFIYHTYFMQNIECIYRFDSKWNSVCPEPLYVNLMLYIASSTISTSGGFGMKMPLLSLLSELWLLLFYTLFSVFPSYHTRFQLWERQTIKITLVKYSFLKRNIIV